MNAAQAEVAEKINIGPQDGPQNDFLASEADIVIYGGAAGGGKTYGLLLEDFRHYDNPKFGSVTFRRNGTSITKEGGLWDESMNLYPLVGGEPREHKLEWNFPSGARASFSHLEYEKTVLDWQGNAIALLKFDELTHFTEYQFFYMLTRNRSTCGVKPYVRGTTNPDPDSWVRRFIDWWIGPDGFPIKERAGKIRWFIRLSDEMIWRDTKEEIHEQYGYKSEIQPKSVTFIPSKLQDNKILMQKDPGYHANLLAQDRVTRERLLGGNWNVRASAGMLFRREWFQVVDALPSGWSQIIRFWDRAATKPNETNKDPDWTRGLKLYKYPDGRYIVGDLKSNRDTPGRIEALIKATASHDSHSVRIMSQQDPGSAGVAEAEYFVRMLSGYSVSTVVFNKDKITRAKPVSAQCEAGNVLVLRSSWNDEFFTELENFPEGAHDDIVDVLSGGFNALSESMSFADIL